MEPLHKRLAISRGERPIIKKKFLADRIQDKYFDADIFVIDMIETKNSWDVPRDNGETVCILNTGYKWLGVYPKNETYAVTGLYDNNKKLVEFYFDMTKENGVENGMPYVVDIFLDLVITPEYQKIVLDENELEEALNEKIIGKEEYDLAYKTLDRLMEKYESKESIDELKNVMQGYLEDMLQKVENEEIIIKKEI